MAVKKLANGKYVADFRDAHGHRFRPQFDNRKEADAALSDAKVRIRKGEFLAPTQIPNFGEVARDWLAARASRRAAVLDNYRRHVECYWLPRLENTRLDRIDVQMIEGFRDDLRKRLAIGTLRSVMNTLGQVLKFAVRHRKLVTNPMYNVERIHAGAVELVAGADPGEQSEGTQAVRPADVLNLDEIRRLIASARPGLYRTLFAVAAATGARSGELFGLTWGAVDLDDGRGGGRISIRQSLSWAKGAEDKLRFRFYPPKTAAGIRSVPIPHEVVMLLKSWKLQCPPGELVFPASDGRPMRRSTVYLRGFVPALTAAKLRTVRLHSLRHSFASAMIEAGAPVTEVAQLLGHANPSITLRVYSHWFKGADSGARDRIAAAMFGRQLGHLVDSNG